MITLLTASLAANGLLPMIVQLVIVGLILYAVWWFIGFVGLPEPINKVARVLVALVGLIYLIKLLLGFSGDL